LKPKKPSTGLLRKFFDWFNRVFDLKKTVVVVVMLVVFAAAGGFFANHIPTSFLPDEDQGYAFVNVQLPNAASLERTRAVVDQVEKIIINTRGVQYSTCFVGFSLLSFVRTTYNATFFVNFKPWDQRTTRAEQFQTLKANLNRQLSGLPSAVAFSFFPPAIPGVGTAGGFTFMLEDRSGGDIAFLAKNLSTFLAAARKRPEIASLSTTFLSDVPQQLVEVARDKVLKQSVNLNDVYRTIQAFMGGYFINYFNRFGRQWQVHIEAEGEDRAGAENVGQFYVRNINGDNVPLSTLTSVKTSHRS
jgi:hydrophobic/amphiphilic exporter-1 (mainly G- bacteria), HAE1 family